jgi:hypothetical protein
VLPGDRCYGGQGNCVNGCEWHLSKIYSHPKNGLTNFKNASLSIRRTENLGSSRARMMNPVVVNNNFSDLESIVHDLKISDKSHCVWNCKETRRNFQHSPVRVITDKKERNVGKT